MSKHKKEIKVKIDRSNWSPEHLAYNLLPLDFQAAIAENWLLCMTYCKEDEHATSVVSHWLELVNIANENKLLLEQLLLQLEVLR